VLPVADERMLKMRNHLSRPRHTRLSPAEAVARWVQTQSGAMGANHASGSICPVCDDSDLEQ